MMFYKASDSDGATIEIQLNIKNLSGQTLKDAFRDDARMLAQRLVYNLPVGTLDLLVSEMTALRPEMATAMPAETTGQEVLSLKVKEYDRITHVLNQAIGLEYIDQKTQSRRTIRKILDFSIISIERKTYSHLDTGTDYMVYYLVEYEAASLDIPF